MTPDQISKLPYRRNVGVMVINADGLIWVGQRIDSKVAAWQMPQGGIDKGEAPREAALRELEEETGISASLVSIQAESTDWLTYELPHDLVPRLWNGKYRGQEQKWFLMRFSGTDADITIDVEHPEFAEWRWLTPADLLASIVPFKHEVYASVLKEFGALI